MKNHAEFPKASKLVVPQISNLFKFPMTHFCVEFDLRGGTGGAERIEVCDGVGDGAMEGNEIGFLALGGAGGRFPRSDDDDMFDRVSSFELLLLLLNLEIFQVLQQISMYVSETQNVVLPFNRISLVYKLRWK